MHVGYCHGQSGLVTCSELCIHIGAYIRANQKLSLNWILFNIYFVGRQTETGDHWQVWQNIEQVFLYFLSISQNCSKYFFPDLPLLKEMYVPRNSSLWQQNITSADLYLRKTFKTSITFSEWLKCWLLALSVISAEIQQLPRSWHLYQKFNIYSSSQIAYGISPRVQSIE